MEVHHHAHSNRKKWTHYFWEFLMLFLAVFCGFFAEYQLEHKIEKDREKVYIKNMYKDLQADTTIFNTYIRTTHEFAEAVDTLIRLMSSQYRNQHLSEIYLHARTLTISNSNTIFPSQATYIQLKHSGQLRLIHNPEVANTVIAYYVESEQLFSQNDFIMGQVAHYWDQAGNLFQGDVFYKIRQTRTAPDLTQLKLLSNDPVTINKFLVSIQYYYGSRMGQMDRVEKMLTKAQALMELIRTKYRLD